MHVFRRVLSLVLFLPALFPCCACAQAFPSKHITLFIGYAAGASTDLSARALGEGLAKQLGVPVAAENKPGAAAGVAAGMVARAAADGYTLGVVSTGVIAVRPHITRPPYDPLNDFTLLAQYARYIGALTVLADSPYKTVDDFIAYAKTHPGLSYSSPGQHTQQQLGVEVLRKCKGLEFRHIPSKGGAEANALLIGKHVDFTAGAGQHIQFVRQGRFRMLVLFNAEQRDPAYPAVPTLKEIGCQDAPALGYLVIAPRGLPPAISARLGEAVRKVVEGAEFQKTLANLEIPYDYKDRQQLEKEIAAHSLFYKGLLENLGVKPE
jgi:tripartite-type tricarboxylate transporter receptor subunit TctC